ncbi:VOC family protein [Streptomyces sp. ID05-04B]|uniref:VOC family protein n=1 Tax=unclassified Streptomyces TaxID=2593676 RepID=UPI000D1A86AD|nr:MULTISPECIES: VOC family protein [unclassified Streptomyces]AVV44210.1 glyoxalase [Streptomyces sp. P3]MDX5568140.1 VOC family protein [Streptomyces sp. ID05-04B]
MSVFTSLGYVVVRGPLDEWTRFAAETIGAQPVRHAGGDLGLRLDEHAYRIVVEDGAPAGPRSLAALGFTVQDATALAALEDRLTSRGIKVGEDEELRARRGVEGLRVFADSDGQTIEAVHGLPLADTPFESPLGVRFVTGELGAGHVFLSSSGSSSELAEFYRQELDFKLTDTISMAKLGSDDDAYFLHCNPRHHSVAVARIPGPPPGLIHIMLEVPDFSTVGRVMSNIDDDPDHIAITLGEHSNDQVTSFYVDTPSGFQIEYGCEGIVIDDATWQVAHYDSTSNWGHKFVGPRA